MKNNFEIKKIINDKFIKNFFRSNKRLIKHCEIEKFENEKFISVAQIHHYSIGNNPKIIEDIEKESYKLYRLHKDKKDYMEEDIYFEKLDFDKVLNSIPNDFERVEFYKGGNVRYSSFYVTKIGDTLYDYEKLIKRIDSLLSDVPPFMNERFIKKVTNEYFIIMEVKSASKEYNKNELVTNVSFEVVKCENTSNGYKTLILSKRELEEICKDFEIDEKYKEIVKNALESRILFSFEGLCYEYNHMYIPNQDKVEEFIKSLEEKMAFLKVDTKYLYEKYLGR